MSDVFLLGGRDLEMQTIRELLRQHAQVFIDKDLAWGTTVAAYADELTMLLAQSSPQVTPVLVELGGIEELTPDVRERCVIIDHHNQLAGVRPSSLRQVFERLQRPEAEWSHRYQLVAANDEAWIPGLLEAGATTDEVRTLRAEERRVLGIPLTYDGLPSNLQHDTTLDLVSLAIDHEHTSAVNDFLHPTHGGPGPTNTLIITPTKATFSGRGDVVHSLAKRYGGWHGGRLPVRGFWGQRRTAMTDTPEQLNAFVQEVLRS